MFSKMSVLTRATQCKAPQEARHVTCNRMLKYNITQWHLFYSGQHFSFLFAQPQVHLLVHTLLHQCLC
jgi:hypothetical protein